MARLYEKHAFLPDCVPEILPGTAFMEEAGADRFEISDLPFVPSGVLAHVLRSDDVAIAVDGTYTNGKAVVTLDADCYHVAGRLSVAIYITDASMNSQCVYACVGNVYRTVGDTELDSGTEVPTLAQLEAAYQACISATQQATNAVSYVEQTGKTDAQKAQARANIGAPSEDDLTDLRGATNAITDSTGVVLPVTLTFTDGRSRNATTGGTNAREGASYSSPYTPCEGYDKIRLTMPVYTAANAAGLAFFATTEQSSYISGVKVNADTSLSVPTYETREIPIPSTAKYFSTTWFASSSDMYSAFSCQLVKIGSMEGELSELNEKVAVVSENVYNSAALTPNKSLSKSGSISDSDSYSVTDYIAVKQGDVIIGSGKSTAKQLRLRVVTAYNSAKSAMSDAGDDTDQYTYTVPSGVAFVRITLYNNQLYPETTIYLDGTQHGYLPYYSGDVNILTSKNYSGVYRLQHFPLTSLPEYFVNTLAYKPLGTLSKGYIAIVSDDGNAALATYTIPMLIAKGVPASFAVMSQSECFETQENTAIVVDAVTNHGCEITYHGPSAWTTENLYDEYTLNQFFDTQATFFSSLGLTAYGACPPTGAANNLIQAICGGRFGCVRDGYALGSQQVIYGTYNNGPRSNLYGLTTQNCVDGDMAGWRSQLDATKTNHWLKMVHLHENELNTAEKKAQLEAIIDYALEIGLEFVTMKDIPSLV